jgi:hypothetical protein
MNGILKVNQVLPGDFAALLAQMHKDHDSRLSMVLLVSRLNGWTLKSLGDALGVSRQAIEHRVNRASMSAGVDLPEVPLPPRKPAAVRKASRRRLLVSDELAERLRGMAELAATVNGGTPADAPERRISEELSALLHSLIKQGVTAYHLAQVLGVTVFAVTTRLGRHGYGPLPASQADTRYIGRAVYEGPKGTRRDECRLGHRMAGANLYVIPKTGARVCRECSGRRRRAYLQRKQQAAAIEGGTR